MGSVRPAECSAPASGALWRYSVLMSTYVKDNPGQLRAALESMAAQTLPPSQVVLVFDGPVGPDLMEAATAFGAAHPGLLECVRLPRNGGLGPALNAGLPKCREGVVVRMDADDLSRSDRCQKQLAAIAEGYDMVGSDVLEFGEDPERPTALRQMPRMPEDIARFARRRSPFAHPAFACRKEVLEAAGGYRDVKYAEDFDLFARLIQQGRRGCNLPEPLVSMRVDPAAYRRRGGVAYLGHMLRFNMLQMREGRFSPADFAVRSAANAAAALMPNALRDLVYKKLLRRSASGFQKSGPAQKGGDAS